MSASLSLLNLHKAVDIATLILSAFIINGVAFGFKDISRLLLNTLCFFIFSFIFTGLNFFFIEVIGIKAAIINGRVYYDIDLILLIILTAFFYLVFTVADKIRSKNKETRLFYKTELILKGQKASFICKLDTGNALKEPFSGDPVLIAEESVLKKLIQEKDIEENKIRLIPYSSLSGEGLLKAFKVNEVIINGTKCTKSCFVAIYKGELNPDYKGLLSPELL